MGGWYEQRIRRMLDSLSAATAQMRLAPMADRDLAVAVDQLLPEDREAVLARLPEAKSRRVRQEREYLTRLRVSPSHRRIMAERLADALEGRGGRRGGTWIAPGRSRRD